MGLGYLMGHSCDSSGSALAPSQVQIASYLAGFHTADTCLAQAEKTNHSNHEIFATHLPSYCNFRSVVEL